MASKLLAPLLSLVCVGCAAAAPPAPSKAPAQLADVPPTEGGAALAPAAGSEPPEAPASPAAPDSRSSDHASDVVQPIRADSQRALAPTAIDPCLAAPGAEAQLGGAMAEPQESSDSLDEPRRLVQNSTPDYPAGAKDLGIEGKVTLELWVDAKGNVERMGVLRSAHPSLCGAALEAARRLRFEPAPRRVAGKAKRIKFNFVFKLR